ncbi:hypothetical protein CD351_07245 [Erythrobacter sp. KY5]|uniref:hypothetical protein n=1 Tax=Erythrobacter sp. KY5 TaxID=2011159 RepID=UPI000DBEFA21|nr:hypothetical protein [Erythrobacter sp. KY5]AWW74223.1 hypothetical protein CD351_07245 [Erythrobacter sp. KY5]
MSKQIQEQLARGNARIVEAPAAPRNQVESDRNFGLPTFFYGATVACYFGFLGLMTAAFGNAELAIPMVIFGLFIIAGFGVPAIWTRLKDNDTRPMTLGNFGRGGIMTATGRLAPRDAAIQVLILPMLIVAWGVAIVTIAAFVA